MALNLKEIEHFDERVKMLIYGYNKNARKLLPKNSSYHNIPAVVDQICLMFYCQRDWFSIYNTKTVKLSLDKLQATVNKDAHMHTDWNTIYGNTEFDNNLYPNTIIEYEISTHYNCDRKNKKNITFGAIGIVSAGEEQENTNKLIWGSSSSKHKQVYSLHCSSRSKMKQIGNGTLLKFNANSSDDYSNGDKIRITVDISGRSITFWSITKAKEIGMYLDIDFSVKHRLAVSMGRGRSIELLSVRLNQKL